MLGKQHRKESSVNKMTLQESFIRNQFDDHPLDTPLYKYTTTIYSQIEKGYLALSQIEQDQLLRYLVGVSWYKSKICENWKSHLQKGKIIRSLKVQELKNMRNEEEGQTFFQFLKSMFGWKRQENKKDRFKVQKQALYQKIQKPGQLNQQQFENDLRIKEERQKFERIKKYD